jgi:hypothetical protein
MLIKTFNNLLNFSFKKIIILLFFVLNISFFSNIFTLNRMIFFLTNIYVFCLNKDLYLDQITSFYFLVSSPNNISSIVLGFFLILIPA